MTTVLPIARWIAGGLLLTISLLLIVMNAAIVIRYLLRKKRSSLGPLVGGVCGCLGLIVLPAHVARWCWVPFLLDLSWPAFVVALPKLAREWRTPHGSQQ